MNCRFYDILFKESQSGTCSNDSKKKSGRDPSLMPPIWRTGKLLEANVEEGYIVGKYSRMVHKALRIIARNCIRLLLSYLKRDDIPSSIIDSIWKEVKI